ncbi:NB-ARC domain-containing protein [Amycolatopsis sp. NPDC051128]|uniref:NB-ARC domain-containing protein n=1 Tax=Amycolatopsis sp. NPDC051128 TaxID=3155412 RepID=UPI003421DFA5
MDANERRDSAKDVDRAAPDTVEQQVDADGGSQVDQAGRDVHIHAAVDGQPMDAPNGRVEARQVVNAFRGEATNVVEAGTIYGNVTFGSGSGLGSVGEGSAVPVPAHRVVARPELSGRVIRALTDESQDDMLAVTGLCGAGGFGKTTLAAVVAGDRHVRDWFRDEVWWVTLGEHVRDIELASKVNDLTARVSGVRTDYRDPEQAGQHLGAVLEGRRCLLIVDDVWNEAQLAPFNIGGLSCRRLVTTRISSVLPQNAVSVIVDIMSPGQARAVLSEGLASTGGVDWQPLWALTGGWPVLLALANRQVQTYARRGLKVAAAVQRVAERLAAKGPAALDPKNPAQRRLAVTATVEVSLDLLAEPDPSRRTRFLELAVFTEKNIIFQQTLEIYWAYTGGLDADEVEQLCLDLADMSLVQGYQHGQRPMLWLHDVMREYIRFHTDADLARYHQDFLKSYRRQLGIAGSE